MKIVGCMQLYNAEPYFPYSALNIAPYVDDLILIFGAQQEYRDIPCDNTWNKVWKFANNEKRCRVHVIAREWESETEQRNAYLNHIRENNLECEILWIVDSDEFYFQKDMIALKDYLNTFMYPDMPNYFLYPFWNFYYDFWHYKINKQGMLKMIKWSDDLCYHKSIPQVLDNIGNSKYNTLWNKKDSSIKLIGIKCFHYAHLAYHKYFYQKELYKLLGSNKRDNVNPNKPKFAIMTDEQIINWIKGNYDWLSRPPNKCTKYTGKHPNGILEIIKRFE